MPEDRCRIRGFLHLHSLIRCPVVWRQTGVFRGQERLQPFSTTDDVRIVVGLVALSLGRTDAVALCVS
eukprot:scaffold8629_cov114-Isochrysis_galbana.AAC.10